MAIVATGKVLGRLLMAATVDFGGEYGLKRLVLRYAPVEKL